ncbi:MAG TPA: hypothetical protein VGL15_12810 [Vicinamibacteria bacterium]|jgi:hypothetical protein
MKARAPGLAAAGLIVVLAAAPCTNAQTAQTTRSVDSSVAIAIDPGGDGDPPEDYCALTGVGCVAGIAGAVPACSACVTVLGCIACAGEVSATIAACLNYSDNCISTNAREGDLCRRSNRCETGGLHCVNNRCTSILGAENQRCSSSRDCQSGLECLPDGEEPDRTAGKCWRRRDTGELCGSSAECKAGLMCDPNTHSCRVPNCSETFNPEPGCACTITDAHPAPQGDCPQGYKCEGGRCERVTITVCACDGSDPPGTCTSCQPPPVGGGPPPPTFFYYPTCYYFYDAITYYTCATYGDHTECSDPQTEYILTDSFCI